MSSADTKDTCKSTKWLVDSGAMSHYTFDKSTFMSYRPIESQGLKLNVANGQLVPIIGIGDVCLKTNKGALLLLKDVEHAPGLTSSIISVPVLDEQGYSSFFVDGKYILTKGSLVIADAERVGKKYLLECVLVFGEDSLSSLWHKRLGHLDSIGVENLVKKKVLPGLQSSTTDKCFYCPWTGQDKTHCKKSDLLKLVHIAFSGPFEKPSFSGAIYFVTFIDDFSRKTWCYALKTKSQVLTAFKKFRSYAEARTHKEIKCVFHNEGYVESHTLHAYCKKRNIQYLCVPPGAPSVNNLAERTTNNIKNMISSILAHAKLPRLYWEMALTATVHVMNLCQAPTLTSDVPDKIWFGENASYDHLRVFGCKAVVRVADNTTRECIFVGYAEKGPGYKFYDPVKMEDISSTDAEFFEEQSITDIIGGKKEQQDVTTTKDSNKTRLQL